MISILLILRTDGDALLWPFVFLTLLSGGGLPNFIYRSSTSVLSSLIFIFAADLNFFAVYSAVFLRILAFSLARFNSSSSIVVKRVLNVQTLRLRVKNRWLIWRWSRWGIITHRIVKGLIVCDRCLMWAPNLLILSVFLVPMIGFIYIEVRPII